MPMHVRFTLPTFVDIGCRAMVRYTFEGTAVTGVGVEFLNIKKDVERRHSVECVAKHERPVG